VDKQYKKKKAACQATYRRNKEQKRLNEQAIASVMPTDGRKTEGNRRRRSTINKLRTENMKLQAKISVLQKQVKKLNLLVQKTNESSSPETPPTSPTKLFVSN
ncbi:unnamed protein product, partial [Rotaria sp. Silwood2]